MYGVFLVSPVIRFAHVFMRKHAQAIRIGNILTRATNLPFHVDGYKILALFHNHGKLLEIATQLSRKEG
jgi:hypothetical protein